LREDEIDRALGGGRRTAEKLMGEGLIIAAALHLKGETRIVGDHHAREKETIRMALHA
jgi:hypothetical protein